MTACRFATHTQTISQYYGDVSARNTTRTPNNMQKLKNKKAKKPGPKETFSVSV